MTARSGDLTLVEDPVAQRLLASTELAQLAYTWLDGSPRSTPMWFHWDGTAVVLGTPVRAPKIDALRARPPVAVTVEQHQGWPYELLALRGDAVLDDLDDVSPEYAASAERYLGPEQGRAWVESLRGQPMVRIRIEPRWANVIDFQNRLPSALTT